MSQRNPLFILFLGLRVVRVRWRSSNTVVLKFSFFHGISGQSKRSSFKCHTCPSSGPVASPFPRTAMPSSGLALTRAHWVGPSSILGCWNPCTFVFLWCGDSMSSYLAWKVGKSFQGTISFCPFGLWSSYLGRPIKRNQRLVNFKWISPCNRSSLTATINLDSTLLSFCVWLAESLPLCPLLSCTPGVLQPVQ